MKHLLIVESPHKAKVIQGFLGTDWIVKASVGHIREISLPAKISAAKKDKYGKFGIDVSGNFDPLFEVTSDHKKIVSDLKASLAKVDDLWLGMDPDREGEAIAWHLVDTLNPKIPVHRVTWNEITQKAVSEGLKNPRTINQNEVDAAMSRQIYDRLFGFSISPVLWKAIAPGTSGGRVQSPALRLIVDREKERLLFRTANYMQLTGLFKVGDKNVPLNAKLYSLDVAKIANGSSFNSKGELAKGYLQVSPENVEKIKKYLEKLQYKVDSVEQKPYSRKPNPPYTTSSFQQDVGTRLGLSSKQIMSIAQKLYESGFSTYMRTDSPSLSKEGTDAARDEAIRLFGKNSVPSSANIYKSKSKNAQEGHEALRPTVNSTGKFNAPASISAKLNALDKNAYKVYECIYNRTVASQMNDAKGTTTTVKIGSTNGPKKALFTTAATVFHELGWMALTKPVDEEESETLDAIVSEGDNADLKTITATEHSTKPPARYTEPQLVAKLEELGIGRPSTYAQIVTVNQDRGYVQKSAKQLFPTWKGIQVAQYVEAKAPNFISYDSTALLEDELDKIESGSLKRLNFLKKEWANIVKYIHPLAVNINWDEIKQISTVNLENGFVVKVNKFGAWLEDDSIPLDEEGRRPAAKLEDDSLGNTELTVENCKKIFKEGSKKTEGPKLLGVLETGSYKGYSVYAREGKFGAFIQAVKEDSKTEKPINHKLPEGLTLEKVDFDSVKSLFDEVKLPRNLSPQFFVGIGNKGAYIGFKKTAKSRRAEFKSLPKEHDPRTVKLEDVKKIWDTK